MFSLSSILAVLGPYKYVAMLPLALVEGPVVALASGFFIRSGYLAILPVFAILMLGDFIPDTVCYCIGRFGNRKKSLEKYAVKSPKIFGNFALLEKVWRIHSWKMMFFSKLAYGLSLPLLVSAGIAHMSYKKFISRALLVTIFQYSIFMSVGYYLGESFKLGERYITIAGIIIAVSVLIFLAGYFFFRKYAGDKIVEMEQEKDINKQII